MIESFWRRGHQENMRFSVGEDAHTDNYEVERISFERTVRVVNVVGNDGRATMGP